MFDQDYVKDCQFIPPKDKGYWICQRKKGLFSKILQELTEQRIKYKKEGKEIESLAIKGNNKLWLWSIWSSPFQIL